MRHPETDEMIPFNDALDTGLIDEKKGVYRDPVTGHELPITEALNRGIIVGQMMSHTETELLRSTYKAVEVSL